MKGCDILITINKIRMNKSEKGNSNINIDTSKLLNTYL